MHRLILIGNMDLQGADGPLTGRITQRRQIALLALLACAGDRPLTREKAIGYLWPESPSGRARARLSDSVYVIRQELGEEAVLAVGDGLRLNPEVIWSDVAAFEEARRDGRLRDAVELYGGPFLDGFHLSGTGAFERWVESQRRRLEDRYRRVLEALAEAAEGEHAWADAVRWWKRRAAEEKTNSRVAMRLMQALAYSGNVAGALQHARIHELLLEEELGVSPPAEIQKLAEELSAGGAIRPPHPSVPGDRDTPAPETDPDPGRPKTPTASTGPGARAPEGDQRNRPREPGPTEEPSAPLPAPGRSEGPTTATGMGHRRLATGVLAVVAFFLIGGWAVDRLLGGDETWVRDHAIPEIEELARAGLYDSAWTVARQAGEVAPEHPELARLLPQFTWLWPELRTDPPGARVLRRPYGKRDAAWEELGTTPLRSFRLPLGASVLRMELEGHRPVQIVPDHYLEEFPTLTLDSPQRLPEEMVRVPGWTAVIGDEAVELADFFIGRYPVTNREYLRFVEAGGYRDSSYWEYPLVFEGDTLSWEEAMAHFTDRTGRPGPSTWEFSSYPEGEGGYPVGGVSWYEAAAYADFMGKALPSVHHWRRAYGSRFFPEHVIPKSNLQSDGPSPVGEHQGMGPFGTYDMAGNVREWSFNERGDARIILGGGWNDPDFIAISAVAGPLDTQPAFDRSPTNGIRLVTYLEDADRALARAWAPVEPRPEPDFLREASPPSDEEFEIYRRMYAYDPTPLEPRVEAVDTARHWVRETVSFAAAYEGERVLLHLYLPLDASPPFQTVLYWPGAGAMAFPSIDQKIELHTGFMVRSGRALAFPVLKGTLERLGDVQEVHPAWESLRFRDRTIAQVQDMRRTVDYLETRGDIRSDRLGFYGWSWGGWLAPVALSMEPRFGAAVLHVAGLVNPSMVPEVNPLNHLSRVTLPVLMLNGRLDATFPLETHARPFFELLGTAPEHKRFVVAESGHFVPQPKLIRESLDWLDRYLGPVEER